ncbi:MAG: restriction endonuclease, partial [Chloroflexota bacterium]
EESDKQFNPRYTLGAYYLLRGFDLFLFDSSENFYISDKGWSFLKDDFHTILEIDEIEGMTELLQILSTYPHAKRADLLPGWENFLSQHSKFGTEVTIRETLRRRLLNLIDRKLVVRQGNSYVMTSQGHAYLAAITPNQTEENPRQNVLVMIEEYNEQQRQSLRDYLAKMDPYAFEYLVKNLLEAMDYEDVQVTQASGDKGVDVVARVQLGITEVMEVVQVKRHQANIGRPTLDQLRGALPYHNAIRGTIITLSDFTKECKEFSVFPGAAPITLINGTKLIELLIENEIGIQKRPVELYEMNFDELDVESEESLI